VNDPVILLPVEQEIAPPGRRHEWNREHRIPAAQVGDHARVAFRNGDDRRTAGGQHQVEGFVARHATRLGWTGPHVEVDLQKT